MNSRSTITITLLSFVWLLCTQSSCTTIHTTPPQNTSPVVIPKTTTKVAPLGYVLQFGAFSKLENAVRLTEQLNKSAVEAYYYIDDDGLFKVRVGNFQTVKRAKSVAQDLVEKLLIADYYIVPPSSYLVNRGKSSDAVRQDIIKTTKRFIGIPYKWGGTSPKEGFDCSGLSMVVYNLNGMNLPRTSNTQFKAGRSISREKLKPADLVFFSTDMSGKVNHVGVYAGNGVFIHAPRTGKKIKKARLSSLYFDKRYIGARTFL